MIDTVVRPDPEAVRWINPAVTGEPQERKIVVTMGEPGGLFVNDRETGEFLWASPLPYTSTERFVIRDIDVETGQVMINMDLVAKELGEQYTICGHDVKGYWSWSYSPRTGLLYIPFNRSCLNQTANDRSVTGASPGSPYRSPVWRTMATSPIYRRSTSPRGGRSGATSSGRPMRDPLWRPGETWSSTVI